MFDVGFQGVAATAPPKRGHVNAETVFSTVEIGQKERLRSGARVEPQAVFAGVHLVWELDVGYNYRPKNSNQE